MHVRTSFYTFAQWASNREVEQSAVTIQTKIAVAVHCLCKGYSFGSEGGINFVDLLSQQVFEAGVQFNVVFAQVAEQLVRPQDLGNSHQLHNTTGGAAVSFSRFLPLSCNVRGSACLF